MAEHVRFKCVVTDSAGLHARPAADFSRFAQGLDSKVTAVAGGRSVDAKSMIAVMSLGLREGEAMMIELEGEAAKRECDRFSKWCSLHI